MSEEDEQPSQCPAPTTPLNESQTGEENLNNSDDKENELKRVDPPKNVEMHPDKEEAIHKESDQPKENMENEEDDQQMEAIEKPKPLQENNNENGEGEEEFMAKPKRPMSAYFFFCNSRRDKCKEEHPNLKMVERQKIMSKEWNQLSPEAKSEFETVASKAKAKFKVEMEKYNAWLAKQEKLDKSEETSTGSILRKPKRPLSAFFLFLNDHRAACRKENPDAKIGEITKILSQKWKGLNDGEKKKYEDKNKEDKTRYQKELAEYERRNRGQKQKQKLEEVDPTELILPAAKVKKIMYLDRSVKSRVSKEALWLITKTTEVFIENFSLKVQQYVSRAGRKTILPKDFDTPLRQQEPLSFLRANFHKWTKALEKENKGRISGNKRKTVNTGAKDDGKYKSRKITSMFAPKAK
eukprot:jgi/Bigna1/86594/estExt_fgenesh1_pg.C_120032